MTIDWARVELPSDRMILGVVRRALGGFPVDVETAVHNVLLLEAEIVHSVLDEGKHNAEDARVASILMEENKRELAAMYEELGLASGPHDAKRLTDQLEAAARRTNSTDSSRGVC